VSYIPSWKCRQEGERTFERNPWGIDRNPYPKHGNDLDDSRHRRDWDDGFRSAQIRHEERIEEEAREERKERQRVHDREENRRRAEEEWEAQREAEREQEEQQPEEPQ
jgi:hypothetical protein